MNPYQGCEHGCAYCYARNVHHYWGFSAGIDFESKIVIKKNAPLLLEKFFLSKQWSAKPILISGNTDCYQPLERKFELTRKLLKVFLKFNNPVGLISKNSLILRDTDLLKQLAEKNLVKVKISITTLDEKLRNILEPRTASTIKRLEVVRKLSEAKIPAGIMIAPVIPGLTNHEIPKIMKLAADAGASGAGFTILRLNGAVKDIFHDWLRKNMPDRAVKIWNQVASCHGGSVNDSQWGRRIKGEGIIADAIHQLFTTSVKKYLEGRNFPEYDLTRFRKNGNLNLFHD